MERVSTGIPELDDLIEGGFKKGSINLLEGTAGSGKSTLAIHYAMQGLKNNEKCVYLSVEEGRDSFFENMKRFGFDLREYEAVGDFYFYELTAQKLKDFIQKGTLGIEDIMNESKVTRMVVDSITAFSLLYEGESEQRAAVKDLFAKIKSWDLTVMLISEAEGDCSKFGLQYLVDGLLILNYNKVGRQRIRTIEVYKMRGTKHRSTEIVYRIEENGIRLYPGETVLEN